MGYLVSGEKLQLWRRRIVLLFGVLGLVVGLSGCRDPNLAFIQGDWFFSVPGVAGITPQSSVHTYWQFDDGKFMAHSCCADRPGMAGSYRVVESGEDVLTLELYDVEGPGAQEGYELTVRIQREAGSISLQGVGPFERAP